jgi:predicted dehydrogenase
MATTPPFTASLLGCGAVIQDFYLPVLSAPSSQIRVTHCFDLNPGNARQVAHALGAVAVTGGLEALLDAPATDGVIVSTPNVLHAGAVTACLAAGRHVFCEKPVATRTDECDAIERALATSDRVLTVNLLRRCFPSSAAMRHLLDTQAIGPPFRIDAIEGGRGGWHSRTGFQFSRPSSGGGVTMDRGSHLFDLLIHWLGVPSLEWYCDDAEGGCESTSVAELSWPGGSRGVVRLSKVEAWGSLVTVEGPSGTAQWSVSQREAATVITPESTGPAFESTVRPRETHGILTMDDALARMLQLWVGGCRGTTPNPTPFHEVRASIDLIAQCYASRQPARPVWLEYQDSPLAAEPR